MQVLARVSTRDKGVQEQGRSGVAGAHVEGAHCELEALPLGADDVRLRDDDVLKVDQARVGAALAHVDQLAVDRDPGRVAVNAAVGPERSRGQSSGPVVRRRRAARRCTHMKPVMERWGFSLGSVMARTKYQLATPAMEHSD